MNRLSKILGTLLLVSWISATSFCFLERAGLVSADDDGSPIGESSQTAPCWNVASAPDKVADSYSDIAPLPHLFDALFGEPLDYAVAQGATDGVGVGVAPPEYCKRWQFVFRAAAPPRAPSFAG